jgi:hypothetical protein
MQDHELGHVEHVSDCLPDFGCFRIVGFQKRLHGSGRDHPERSLSGGCLDQAQERFHLSFANSLS